MIIIPLPLRDIGSVFAGLASDPFVVFLNGACGHGGDGGISYLAIHPLRSVVADTDQVWVDGVPEQGDALTVLQRELRPYHHPSDGPVPFLGGAIGAVGYELGYDLEHWAAVKPRDPILPKMMFGFYDTLIACNHQSRHMWVIGRDAVKARQLADRVMDVSKDASPLDWTQRETWNAEQSRDDVERKIQNIIDYIYAGDVYQANYTQKFIAQRRGHLDDATIYRRLCALSPAPFSAFLRHGDVTLASASPERFLRLKSDGLVEAWPIKGTRPRGTDPERDAALAQQLAHSAKDQAENLMIVDLMRNDLARVCDIGSVSVPQLNQIESFSSVHHLVSWVQGRLRAGLDAIDILRATFPGGSITGAPKIRAMQIIQEHEPSPRGFYCGCLGWIGFDGQMDMSMIIRTLTLTRDRIVAQAGGGIVADSDPAAEYDESMTKMAPLLRAVSGGAE